MGNFTDFTGFSFGNKHSFDLGIVRVSSGDGYDDVLHPEAEDKTAEVPGMDGSYYFGSDYKNRSIKINIAFDSLTESQLRNLRRTFDLKKVKELIFDELPYKKYIAKVENPIELSYICFDERKRIEEAARNGVRRDRDNDTIEDETFTETIVVPAEDIITYQLPKVPKGEVTIEGTEEYTEEDGVYTFVNENEEDVEVTISFVYEVYRPAWEQVTPYSYLDTTERIYKGTGSIEFVCFFPFAKSAFKKIPSGQENCEWVASSGILTATEYQSRNLDTYDSSTGIINIYNGGDLKTNFRLYVPGAPSGTMTIAYKKSAADVENTAVLVINSFSLESSDTGFLIDTMNQLIIGVKNFGHDIYGNVIYETSGNIYNQYINSGYFFQLEPNELIDNSTIQIVNGSNGIEILYDYIYF